jgi:hypothetical protein
LFVNDPGLGNVQIRRRRTRRHRRHRLIRRGLLAAVLALFTAAFSSLALRHFSPSLFRAQQQIPSFQQVEESRTRVLAADPLVAPSADRPVYPYSVVPGGVEDAKELKWVAEHDPVVAAHYAGFDYDHARVVRLTLAQTVYVSYRIGNHIYWTRRRITLRKGEKLITDGKITARTRCANRVEKLPEQAASRAEPRVEEFEKPVPPAQGTAVQSPPVPFESALLNRTPMPGLEPAAVPLSLYNPFVPESLVPIAPPPLPSGGVCVPAPPRKKGEVADFDASSAGSAKKKHGNGCGSTTPVPEPGTWIMLLSGLGGAYWQVRRKLTLS